MGASFKKGEDVLVKMLLECLEETYRKVAPKKLVAQMGGAAAVPQAGQAGQPDRARSPSN